jgi:hypothetical protein
MKTSWEEASGTGGIRKVDHRSSLWGGLATGVGIGPMKTHGKQLNAMTTPDPNQELATERGFHPVPAAWPWLRGGNGDIVPAQRVTAFPWARAVGPPQGVACGVPRSKTPCSPVDRSFSKGAIL